MIGIVQMADMTGISLEVQLSNLPLPTQLLRWKWNKYGRNDCQIKGASCIIQV